MQTQPKTGGGCKPKGINKPDHNASVAQMLRDPETWHKERLKNEAIAKQQRDEWLKTPAGVEHLHLEAIRAENEAKRITQAQWDNLFNELFQRGFCAGDKAILDPERNSGLLATVHGKTGRDCVYVQISSLIDLYDRPKWMINPFHWRGALVCFIEGYKQGQKIIAVECIRRGPNSAWVKVVEVATQPCAGCGRRESHKMCPAWGTPIYMTGKLLTPELEAQYADMRKDALEKQRSDFAACVAKGIDLSGLS